MIVRRTRWLISPLSAIALGALGCANGSGPVSSVFSEAGAVVDARASTGDATTGDDASGSILVMSDGAAPDRTTQAPSDGGCEADACGATFSIASCGEGKLDEPGKQCDDGNTKPGDGCSGSCQIEPGWACPTPGQPCVYQWVCGNGVVDPGEQCDLGAQNGQPGSGCSATCTIVAGYSCANGAGDAGTDGGGADLCAAANTCGDGIIEGSEQCDSGALNGTGGCTTACTIVPGWVCPKAGFACVTVCGDGIVAGGEQCDFGAAADGGSLNGAGGCSSQCTVMPGYACTLAATSAAQCHLTVCGDGIKDGSEQCDDGNLIPYDGCSPSCTIEPTCNGMGGCTAVCGDGLVEPGEQCDLGALNGSGEGCTATCQVQPGFSCTNTPEPPAPTLVIPILYRDMIYWNGPGQGATITPPTPGPVAGGHPDFNQFGFNSPPQPPPIVSTGEVQPLLGPEKPYGKPIFASIGNPQTLTTATNFCWWFHDSGCGDGGANPYAKLVYLDLTGNPTTLTLTQAGSGTYTYENIQFFPLDGLGWNAGTNPELDTDCEPNPPDGGVLTHSPHNFSFSSEVHYIFTYQASVAASANPAVFNFVGDDDVWGFINNQLVIDLGGIHTPAAASFTLNTANAATLGLVDGGWYSIDVFQSEAHVCRSTYGLTLSNFVHIVSQCTAQCGSGVPAPGEQCDYGTNASTGLSNNTGGCGGCNANCTLGPYCGDGVVEAQCGEQCDLGAGKNTGGCGGCNANCTLGPYCGDGILQTQCGEQCDYGTAGNTGACGGCNANCTLGPYCGDGVVEAQCGEQCDNGAADVPVATAYGQGLCTTACLPAPYCGDGTVQAPFGEQCDNGASNVPAATAYGMGLCTTSCTLAPYCGDGIVESQFGEQCDGTPGCNAMCMFTGAN